MGEVQPTVAERVIAGDDLLFYQEYIHLPGLAERDAERDLRQWLTNIYFSLSASAIPPLPTLDSDEAVIELLRNSAACVGIGQDWSDRFSTPEKLPDWLPQEDLDVYVEEYERTGMTTAFNSYRTNDLDWELLGPYADTPLTVPALFVGGDRDVPTIWGREALRRFGEVATDVRGSVVLEECGHWVQQEKPEEFNQVLLEFLRGL